ncbi:MAG TPA: hypothetical protein VNQ73_09895 [Ilumatobacter sp.]|nr:hypothetical protein [Ilumatobacter sp.]
MRRAAVAATLIGVLAACGGDDATDDPPATATPAETTQEPPSTPSAGTQPPSATATPATPPAPSTTVPDTILSVAHEHLAFTLALPEEHALRASGHDDFAGNGSCVYYWWQLAGGVDIEAWPANCDPANSEPGNGSFGHYRTLADAPGLQSAGEAHTVLGPATLGEQVYYECTNSCVEWPLDIAVIELSEPVDAEYPTLAIVATARNATTDDLRALLAAFGAG